MLLRTYPLITHPAFLRHVENAVVENARFQDLRASDVPTHCPRICTPYDLSQYLGIHPLVVRSFVANKEKHYRTFEVKKRSGGVRTINAPRTFLKVAQWWILDVVLGCEPDLPVVYGFTKGRSFVDNARAHHGASHILNVDILNFFPSVTRLRVLEAFEKMGYRTNVANFLSEVCTLEGELPQGAPTSPALSNVIFRDCDIYLQKVATEIGCTYTRYADDMTFSSTDRLPAYLLDEISSAIRPYGFTLNRTKTRFMGRNQKKEVTGLVLGQTGVALSQKYLNGTRGWFHSISETPELYQGELRRVEGTLNLIKQVGGRGTARLLIAGEQAVAALRTTWRPKIEW